MKKITITGILILLTIISTQCRKYNNTDNGNNHNDDSTTISKAPITATLQGNITDETGQPSSGVIITVGDKTATTDNNGYFRITAAALDKQASFVLAQKPGYFNAYRSFCATSGTNQIAIQLIKRTLSGTVSATSGGTIILSNGAKITLPANGVVNAASNAAYTGTVNVYAAYIDPSDNSIAKTIPGSFMANDKNNNRVSLASYGMLAVELQSSDGQKLQIATGNTATLTTPIPSSLQAKAPATISMWYMNEQTGLWQEEGSATKIGDNYVGAVKHFSFWNCDSPFPSVQLSATIKTSDGLPLTYGYVVLQYADTTYPYGAGGYTDSLGVISGAVPVNANLILKVFDQCYNIVYSKNIGAISSTTDLGTITIPSTTVGITTITGKLVTCSNTPVSNGYAVIYYKSSPHYVLCDNSGNFSTNFIQCPNDNTNCQILGVDINSGLQGNITTFQITTPTTNVGTIIACGVRTPYNITIKGKLLDCNNAAVSNGKVYIAYNPEINVNCDGMGNFTATMLYNPDSSTSCQITGTNLITQLQGNPTTINIASILTNGIADVGNIVACGNKVNIPYYVTVTGKLIDCNSTPVSNGVAILTYNGYSQTIACNSSSSFSTLMYYDPSNSPNSFQIIGVDATAKQQGNATNFILTSILNEGTANTGNITACGTTAISNITYSIDGIDSSLLTLISNFQTYTTYGPTVIGGFSTIPNRYGGGISFDFSDNSMITGTFPLSDLYLAGYSTIKLIQPFNINITNYPQNIGDNYEGSFSGQFTDSTDVNHTVHTIICSFKQPRTN
jgi:hypothetical protein